MAANGNGVQDPTAQAMDVAEPTSALKGKGKGKAVAAEDDEMKDAHDEDNDEDEDDEDEDAAEVGTSL